MTRLRDFLNHHSATVLHPWTGVWLAVPIAVVILQIGRRRHDPSWPALAGAVVAILGVLTVGRPIIRLGYADWFRRSETIDGGDHEPTPEARREDLERRRHGQAVQLRGPSLIIAGTLLNAASGFLA